MGDEKRVHKSFSPWKRWGFRLDLIARTALVLAVVVMINYLGARWYQRFYFSSATRMELSPLTMGLLKSITNQVSVTLFYDRDDPLFPNISALLKEYQDANSRIHVVTVDYVRDPGEAQKLMADERYKPYLAGVTNKNLVVFECEGRLKVVNGRALAQYIFEPVRDVQNKDAIKFNQHTMFYGQSMFTAALLNVTSPKPLKAYFLTGHGEHRLDGADELGYLTFKSVLQQNNIVVETLSLLGTNTVPADCNLLIIAGPRKPFLESERERIDNYLHEGGRLLALVNAASIAQPTGLETILAGWGVKVNDIVVDPKNTTGHEDVIALDFSTHPMVNPLHGSALHLVRPRAIGRLDVGNPPADAPHVEAIAFSSELAHAGPLGPARFPLAVAVEKGRVPGVITERGSTRIVAVGDSLFLGNQMIASAGNRDFLGYAINWLLERTQLMQGLGPRPIKEFRLAMTTSQLHTTQWILLAGMPGAVLLLGGLVWLRRRK
jgi:LPXTG-motif cell wall-anchored protein